MKTLLALVSLVSLLAFIHYSGSSAPSHTDLTPKEHRKKILQDADLHQGLSRIVKNNQNIQDDGDEGSEEITEPILNEHPPTETYNALEIDEPRLSEEQMQAEIATLEKDIHEAELELEKLQEGDSQEFLQSLLKQKKHRLDYLLNQTEQNGRENGQ